MTIEDPIGTKARRGVNTETLIFFMDAVITRSEGDPVTKWEHQLLTEPIRLESELKPAVTDFINKIIGYSRMGLLKPDEYARRIIKENQGLPPSWRYLSESTARVNDRMVEEEKRGGTKAQGIAAALSESFEQVIKSTGIRYEGDMGDAMRGLLDKLKKFPQEPE